MKKKHSKFDLAIGEINCTTYRYNINKQKEVANLMSTGFYPRTSMSKSVTCVDFAIIRVMLWHVDSAPFLKCNGCGLESWLAGHLVKGNVHWRGRPSV